MQTQSGLDRKHLDLAVMQRLARFSFIPRRFLEGRYTGRHASPQRGQSVEFRDYRQYLPGDDMGQVDWKVYGRTDKFYVRLFEHETELTVTLLVDASSSMSYDPRRGDRKYDHACRLAAALGFVIIRGQDRVGFGLARDGLVDHQRPSSAMAQLRQMLETMENRQPRGQANLATALEQLAGNLKRGEIVIVFSDLWDDLHAFYTAASQIRHRGGELIVFHVLHGDELELPRWSDAVLIDSETMARMHLNLDDVRGDYARKLGEHLSLIQRSCKQFEIQYQFAPMTEPFQQTLERYLARRVSS